MCFLYLVIRDMIYKYVYDVIYYIFIVIMYLYCWIVFKKKEIEKKKRDDEFFDFDLDLEKDIDKLFKIFVKVLKLRLIRSSVKINNFLKKLEIFGSLL